MKRTLVTILVILMLSVFARKVASAQGQSPQPNPLSTQPPRFPLFATRVVAIPDVNLDSDGAAVSIHGDPARGRTVFAERCSVCHGVRGIGGIPNPGSSDGTVPTLNPIDPGFLADAHGDPTAYVEAIDKFIQHGSRPAGPDPDRSMIPWGDRNLLPQDQIADVEAYVMQLNGLYWPDRWAPPAEVEMSASRDGDTVTYDVTLVNHSSAGLYHLDLTDTLPAGLTYVSSSFPDAGQNSAKWSGSTIEWVNEDGVAPGGTLGPFVIVAQVHVDKVPPNVAQLSFTWSTWDGSHDSSSAVSDKVTPDL